MNKKGFTLVELLAVIIILALLAVIASTSVTKVVDDSKNDLETAQIKLIKDAAKTWGAENISDLPEGNSCIYLTLKDLKTYGLIDSDIKNPKTEKKLSNDLKIKITSKISNYNTQVLNYEVDPASVEGCKIYQPPICKLVEGNPKEIGSKYECEVKPGTKYNFYVLSYEKDGSTNLIMDRNVCVHVDGVETCVASWTTYSSNSYGPIMALGMLKVATEDWINISLMNYEYYDREWQKTLLQEDYGDGYESVIIKNGIAVVRFGDPFQMEMPGPFRARLPIYACVYDNGVKTNEYGEVADYDGTNGYLYENIDNGYWTMSSAFGTAYSGAYGVNSNVVSIFWLDVDPPDSLGVRPVINVKL